LDQCVAAIIKTTFVEHFLLSTTCLYIQPMGKAVNRFPIIVKNKFHFTL